MPDPRQSSDFRSHPDHTVPEGSNILDSIIDEGGLGETAERREKSRSLLKDFTSQILQEAPYQTTDVALLLETRIQALDQLIATQVNEVLHDEEFQNLEAAWIGLSYLVDETAKDQNVVLQIYSASAKELAKGNFQSQLRDLVIGEQLGSLGADPISALIGIYEVTKHPQSVRWLSELGRLAADAHAPFLTGAHALMLDSDSYPLSSNEPLTQQLELDDNWHHLVHESFAQQLLLALPRVLMRHPYQKARGTPRYSHEEGVDGGDSSKYLWGSPLWPIAAQLAHAFSAGSWCADLSVRPQTGVSQGFPSVWIQSAEGDLRQRGPLEVAFSDTALYQLRHSGLTALSCDAGTNRLIIDHLQTLYRSPETPEQAPSVPHLLRDTIGRNRLEQYIISMARELRGRVSGPDQFLRVINHWVETNFPGNSNVLQLSAISDEVFHVTGAIEGPSSTAPFHVSVSVRLYTTQLAAEPDSSRPTNTAQPNAPAVSIVDEVRPYFELLQQTAELSQRGLISDAEQESIKRSILKKVQHCLGDSPDHPPGRTPSPTPLFVPLFPAEQDRSRVSISFDSAQTASAGDYAILFDVIEDIHSLLSPYPFEVETIHKASPGAVIGATFAPVAQALTQILSFGNQIKDLRLASVKVKEAKLDLSHKEIEFDDYKRRMEIKWRVSQLDEKIEAARKDAELEELREKRDEAIHHRTKLVMDELAQKYDLLSKALPVLQSLPPAMQEGFKRDLSMRLERLGDTTVVITEVRQLDATADLPTSPTLAP